MNLSKQIADMILEMLEISGSAEIQRNAFAEQLGCVPSQINYVLSSRFTPERGYIVESRRGGGGYIRITRAGFDADTLKMHLVNSVGDAADEKTCRAHIINLHERGLFADNEAALFLAATNDNAYRGLPPGTRDALRASIFKHMLLAAI